MSSDKGRHGGARPGAGRPVGAVQRVSREARQQAAETGILPHEFLLAVTRGEEIDGYRPSFAERMDAAKAAAGYFAPKLAATEHTGEGGAPLQIIVATGIDRADA